MKAEEISKLYEQLNKDDVWQHNLEMEIIRYADEHARSKLQALKEDVLDLGFVEAPVMRRRENDDGSFSGHRENAILVEREEVINLITNLEDNG